MRKYYNYETNFRILKDEIVTFLKKSGVYYELSGCTARWHFEILCNTEEVEKVNTWLDEHTITEQ